MPLGKRGMDSFLGTLSLCRENVPLPLVEEQGWPVIAAVFQAPLAPKLQPYTGLPWRSSG